MFYPIVLSTTDCSYDIPVERLKLRHLKDQTNLAALTHHMGTAEAKAPHFGAGSRTKSIPREPVERPQSTTSTISSWIVPLVMRYQPSSNTQKLHRMTLYIMMMMMMMVILIILILRSIHLNWYGFKIQTKIWACLGPLNHPTFGVPKLLCSLVDLTPRQALKACDTRSQRSFWQQFCSVQREMHRSQAYMLNLGGPWPE